MIRRTLFKNAIIVGSGAMLASKLMAQTPPQPEGPFYPVVDQIDKDADLIRVEGQKDIAKGEIVIVRGVVHDQNQKPIKNAKVEIWQACHSGRYDHPSDPNTSAPMDKNFQYWGVANTNEFGEYAFRTIRPGSYPAGDGWVRPPHIHFKIAAWGYHELITQMYFADETLNTTDLLLQKLNKKDQEKLVIRFYTQENSKHPVGHFNIEIDKI